MLYQYFILFVIWKARRKIAYKCKGLPLALKSLVGLLPSKSEVDEWRDILRSEILELPNCLNGVLMLSYNDLPAHLSNVLFIVKYIPKIIQSTKTKLFTCGLKIVLYYSFVQVIVTSLSWDQDHYFKWFQRLLKETWRNSQTMTLRMIWTTLHLQNFY